MAITAMTPAITAMAATMRLPITPLIRPITAAIGAAVRCGGTAVTGIAGTTGKNRRRLTPTSQPGARSFGRALACGVRSQPSGQRRHVIAMRLVLRGLAEIRSGPAHEHIVGFDPGDDADVILAAAPDRDLHSQLDLRLLLARLHR